MYIQIKNNKRIALIFAGILFLTSLHSQVFFDSEGGVALDAAPKTAFEGVDLNVRGYYGSQIQLGYNILIESEFSFITQSLLLDSFLQDIPATFNLDKLSFAYNIAGRNFTSWISLFAGTYDGIGTDDFAQKYFGTQPFNSALFDKQIAKPQPSIMSINGFGLEANTIFNNSMAFALYAYYNEKENEISTDNYFNFDLRFATINNIAFIDFIAGVGLPFKTKDDNGNDAILIIETAELHTALSMLIGDNPFANLYFQAGVTKIQINPQDNEEVFSLKNLHVLLEPRFNIDIVNTALTLYFMPQENVDLIDYLEYPVGGNLHVAIAQNIGKTKANFGAHTSISYGDGLNLNFDVSTLSVMFTPYMELSSGSGQMKVSLPVKPLKFATPEEMISASISYKTSF